MRRPLPLLLCAAVFLFAVPAYAAGGPPLVGFIQTITNFLCYVLGPGIFVIGLAFVGFSYIFGNPNAKQNGMSCLLGGAIVFSAGEIGTWLLSAVH